MLLSDVPLILVDDQHPEWYEALGILVCDLVPWKPSFEILRCEQAFDELEYFGRRPQDDPAIVLECRKEIAGDLIGLEIAKFHPHLITCVKTLIPRLNDLSAAKRIALTSIIAAALSNTTLGLTLGLTLNFSQEWFRASLRAAFIDEMIGYANQRRDGFLLNREQLEILRTHAHRNLVYDAMIARSCSNRNYTQYKSIQKYRSISSERSYLYRDDERLHKNTGGISRILPWQITIGERIVKYALVGSMIPWSFVPMEREYDAEYAAAEIKIAVETEDETDVARVVESIMMQCVNARMKMINPQLAPNKKHHWLWLYSEGTGTLRKIVVFSVPSIVCAVRTFHLNCVRAFYGAEGLQALPSFLAAYVCCVNDRPRNLPFYDPAKQGSQLPMARYAMRGFFQIPWRVCL